MGEYANGGLISGPPDPEMSKRLLAQLQNGCPLIPASWAKQHRPGLLEVLNRQPIEEEDVD